MVNLLSVFLWGGIWSRLVNSKPQLFFCVFVSAVLNKTCHCSDILLHNQLLCMADRTADHFRQTPLSMKHMINIFSADLNTRINQDQEEITITAFDCSVGEGICLKTTGDG